MQLSFRCSNNPITWMQHTLHLNGSQYKEKEKSPRQNPKGLRRLIQLMWFLCVYLYPSPSIAAPSHALSVRIVQCRAHRKPIWMFGHRLILSGQAKNFVNRRQRSKWKCRGERDHRYLLATKKTWPFQRFRPETICFAHNRNIPWWMGICLWRLILFPFAWACTKRLARNSKRWPQQHI